MKVNQEDKQASYNLVGLTYTLDIKVDHVNLAVFARTSYVQVEVQVSYHQVLHTYRHFQNETHNHNHHASQICRLGF